MIRQLRRRHRAIFIALAVVLVVLFIAALLVRPQAPPPNALRLPSSGDAR